MHNFLTFHLLNKRKAYNWVQNYPKYNTLQIFCLIFLNLTLKMLRF